jgi:pilus assembly protein CpaB
MNRTRLILIGVLALIVAGFISLSVYSSLSRRLAAANVPRTEVVAAAHDLSVGAQITEADLKVVKVPPDSLPMGTFRTSQELIGRGVIQPIAQNELVLSNKVASANAGAGLPPMIPPGMRAVSVKVNDVIAVAGFTIPGTRVDVLLTGDPKGNQNDKATVTTTTVLQNVQVLAAGQKLQRDAEGKPENIAVITLLVSPDDAQKLTLASTEGKIQLSLRNPLDVATDPRPSVQNIALYMPPAGIKVPAKVRRAAAAAPAKPVPTFYAVEVIKGDKRDTAKF